MSDVPVNNFLNEAPGPGGSTVFAPAPLFSEEGVSPGVQQAGRAIGESIAESGAQFLGQKGMLNSSFLPVLTERAFATGQLQALQAAQQQQSLFAQWAALQNQLAIDTGPELEGLSLKEALRDPKSLVSGIGSSLLDDLLGLDLF
jgi:hypothetical protein